MAAPLAYDLTALAIERRTIRAQSPSYAPPSALNPSSSTALRHNHRRCIMLATAPRRECVYAFGECSLP